MLRDRGERVCAALLDRALVVRGRPWARGLERQAQAVTRAQVEQAAHLRPARRVGHVQVPALALGGVVPLQSHGIDGGRPPVDGAREVAPVEPTPERHERLLLLGLGERRGDRR